MIELLSKAVDVATQKAVENFGKSFEFKLPDFLQKKSEVSDVALEARAEAAAYSASKFFNIPEAKIQKGESIGVYKNSEGTFLDDVFEYNLDQFKKMECTSFEDMSKVWAHECGHRLLQNIFPNSWADELGADFFAGARSEMMGLPKGNFEKMLSTTKASESHPDGALRMQAMDYGRFTVTQMKKSGIKPTWENCIEAFTLSPFSKMTFADTHQVGATGFIDNKAYHYGKAADAQAKVNWNLKKSNEASARGDFKKAQEYAHNANRWQSTVKDAKHAASRSTKLIDTEDSQLTGFIDNRSVHLGDAARAQDKVKYNLEQSKKFAEKNDFKTARDYARSAERWQKSVNDAKRAADRCTKLIDDDFPGKNGDYPLANDIMRGKDRFTDGTTRHGLSFRGATASETNKKINLSNEVQKEDTKATIDFIKKMNNGEVGPNDEFIGMTSGYPIWDNNHDKPMNAELFDDRIKVFKDAGTGNLYVQTSNGYVTRLNKTDRWKQDGFSYSYQDIVGVEVAVKSNKKMES